MYYYQVQIHLYSHLAAEFCSGSLGSSDVCLRDMAAVEQLLLSLREHYGSSGEGREEVRSYILLVIKQFITTVT